MNERRDRIGARRHRATVTQHNGATTDEHGHPTYTTPGDWDTVVSGWPCELLTTGGTETSTGRQTSAYTTHVFHGAYSGGSSIEPDMKLTVDGVEYAVTAVYDPTGDRREIKVEATREIT